MISVSTAATFVVRLLLSLTFRHGPYNFDSDTPALGSYDFIVVGAGAGGSAVASRLSESRTATVLLLEAGPSAPQESAVPGFTSLMFGTDVDWSIKGKPQRNTQMGYEGQASTIISGRMVGGSTALNALYYARGHRSDFNSWEVLGNEGWNYDAVLPYFKKSENYQGDRDQVTDQYHGTGGPVNVITRSDGLPLENSLRAAANELGYDVIDSNGPTMIGFSPVQMTILNGLRNSAGEAFLRPVASRSNLHILPRATVTTVLIDEEKKVQGVQYTFKGQQYTATAMKEVVLCAGAIHTPKLLMLSGIGPPRVLTQLGIKVVSPLPGVGQNLQNHFRVPVSWLLRKGVTTSLPDLLAPKSLAMYISLQRGPLSISPGVLMHSYFNLKGDDSDWPDVDLYLSPITYALDGGSSVVPAVGLKRQVFNEILGPLQFREGMSIHAMLTRPYSRGSITLKSADPQDPPTVDSNFYDDHRDLDLQVKAIQQAFRIMDTESMKALLPEQPDLTLRACAHHGNLTEGYWGCYARHLVQTDWHFCCTAKMAPSSDPMGVVSSRLRVRGVSGLRVVDASVMPHIVTANTMASVYMIAEKAADMIKSDWGYPVQSPHQ
ncbi:Glucose-methanol-choline oxidoreductase N-terminal [Trinorchestia longiramus]|nr:Glucose-methanol-choline oxidoreductase N-terminal [Trinorchestia longiramus]